MATWEDEDFEVSTTTVIASKGKWEGEDEDEEDIPDEWDAESEDEKPKAPAAAPPPKHKKSVKQAIAERTEREKKEAEERRAQGLDIELADETPQQRRERERAAEIEADLEAAQELFTTTKIKSTNGETDDIANFRPRTKEEFDEFSKRLTEIITSVSNMPHYAMFVTSFVKAIAEPLGSEDVKKVSSALTALGNEKLKAEKGPGKGKKAAKKPTLVVGAAKSAAPKYDTRAYDSDDNDDFDFM